MTVAELITLLSTLDQTKRVFVRGDEDGVDDINRANPIAVQLNANPEWYYGDHAIIYDPKRDGPIDCEGYLLSV